MIQDYLDYGAPKEIRVDLSVPLMSHYLTDLGSLILIQITPKERSLNIAFLYYLLLFVTFIFYLLAGRSLN